MSVKGVKEGMAGKVLRTVFILVFLFQALLPVVLGQSLEGMPASVKNPQDLERWLSGFESQMQIPDVPQTTKEMLNNHAGDCDDFATLASKALKDLGIPSTVLVIKYKGINISHAICLWKNEKGTYDFFTTNKRVHTVEKTVDAVVKRYYPSSESVSVLDIDERDALSEKIPESWGFFKT